MSNSYTYKSGLDGNKPDFIDKLVLPKDALSEKERGYEDHLKNNDLAEKIAESLKSGLIDNKQESYDSSTSDSDSVSRNYADKVYEKRSIPKKILSGIYGFIVGIIIGWLAGCVVALGSCVISQSYEMTDRSYFIIYSFEFVIGFYFAYRAYKD